MSDRDSQPLCPSVKGLETLIEEDPEINMFFHQMFSQIPQGPPYNSDPMSHPQVRDYRHMLQLLNCILKRAPEFHEVELVAVPIHALLTWPMATSGGYQAFLNVKVNKQLQKILNAWGKYLTSTASCNVLTEDPETWVAGRVGHGSNARLCEYL